MISTKLMLFLTIAIIVVVFNIKNANAGEYNKKITLEYEKRNMFNYQPTNIILYT